MKKVLIIGFLHPFTIPGGSFRTLPLATHLPEFGWEPVIITPSLTQKTSLPFRVIETQYEDVLVSWKKLFGLNPNADAKTQIKERFGKAHDIPLLNYFITRIGEILNYPDSFRGWKSFALEAGMNLIEHEKVDALFSCHPTISHIITGILNVKYNIPWIADFPDLWSQNHNYQYSLVRRAIDRRLEKRTLSNADILTTVSEPFANKLGALHPGKPIYSITHGFDQNLVNDPPTGLTEKFTITYTGTIYRRRQNPLKLFSAMRDLISSNTICPEDIEVRFFSPEQAWLDKAIVQYGLSGYIRRFDTVPRMAAINKQRESQLLLLLDWEDAKEKGVHTGKIFEYLGSRRPVIATGGSEGDVVGKLLDETNAGIQAITVEEIKNAISNFYNEYKSTGSVAYKGIESVIDKYSHREMARKFADLFDRMSR